MTKVAVVLAGCGHLDGAEIRESVLSLLYLDQQGAKVTIFAPDITQVDVVNHLTGKPSGEVRNVLAEAARIARGKVSPLSEAKASEFDALVLPGGFGVAKNLSTLASEGAQATVLPDYARLIGEFHQQGKPIGAICIAPAVLALALKGKGVKVTIGEDASTAALIESCGGQHEVCASTGAAIDTAHNIVSCSAYMRDDALASIAQGIEKVIREVIALAKAKSKTKAA